MTISSIHDGKKPKNSIAWASEISQSAKTFDKGFVEEFEKYPKKLFPNMSPLEEEVTLDLLRSVYNNDISGPICQLIEDAETSAHYQGNVVVYPLMCGLGKSTAISRIILSALNNDDDKGILIITDRKDRIKEYTKPKFPAFTKFFEAHRSQICELYGDTFEIANPIKAKCKVLITTTQHFYRVPTKRIDELLCWGENKTPRSLVIFDEDPIVAQPMVIALHDFRDISTAIDIGLPEDPSFKEKKEFCRSFWADVTQAFDDIRLPLEREHPGKGFYCLEVPRELDQDDIKRFLKLITENSDRMENYNGKTNNNVCQRIRHIVSFLGKPVLLCLRDDRTGSKTSFSVLCDQSEHFKALTEKTRVVVLDGTARMSPNYELHPELFSFGKVVTNDHVLSDLTIHLINKPCGHATIKKMKLNEKKELTSLVKESVKEYEALKNAGVFTYKGATNLFAGDFPDDNIGHFGDLAGRNKFRKLPVIAQVGLHYLPPELCLVYTLAFRPDFKEKLLALDLEEQNALIQQETSNHNSFTWELLTRFTCVDIEQNLFRGTIRDYPLQQIVQSRAIVNSSDPAHDTETNEPQRKFHYLLFFNFSYYKALIQKLKDRFEPLGGVITFASETDVLVNSYLKSLQGGHLVFKDTPMYALFSYLRIQDPSEILSLSKIMADLKMSKSKINKIRESVLGNFALRAMHVGRGKYKVGNFFNLPEIKRIMENVE